MLQWKYQLTVLDFVSKCFRYHFYLLSINQFGSEKAPRFKHEVANASTFLDEAFWQALVKNRLSAVPPRVVEDLRHDETANDEKAFRTGSQWLYPLFRSAILGQSFWKP